MNGSHPANVMKVNFGGTFSGALRRQQALKANMRRRKAESLIEAVGIHS